MLSAPALDERWWARRGGGAWARERGRRRAAPDPRLRRRRRSATPRSSTARAGTSRRPVARPGFEALLGAAWRERGFGDFWGYALLAEGAAEAMVEVDTPFVGGVSIQPQFGWGAPVRSTRWTG